MNNLRRQLIKGAIATSVVTLTTSTGLMKPILAEANDLKPADFGVMDFETVMNEMGGLKAETSEGIDFAAPDVAENGAIVPVEVFSHLPDTDSIAILVEKNAIPLVAKFDFRNGGVGHIATRIKMAESCPVHAVVRAGGKIYRASKMVTVTLSGCEFDPSPMKSKDEK